MHSKNIIFTEHPNKINLLLASIYILSVLFFITLIQSDQISSIKYLDTTIINFVAQIRTPILTHIFIIISWMGNQGFYIIIFAVIINQIYLKKNTEALNTFILSTFGGYANIILKSLIMRSRPPIDHLMDTSGSSFPSGHAMGSLICFSLMNYSIYNSSQRARIKMSIIISIVVVLLIGTSRVYLGVHFVSDVIGGYFGGVIWLLSPFVTARIVNSLKNKA